jgi:DNA (cytosine-5)-methyltransferase 1
VLTLGSLFDGIAGFPLAASRHGIRPVWASEIEPFPIRVSQSHFPDMKHHGSITDIVLCVEMRHPGGIKLYVNDAHDNRVKPVGIITFGSPCQDLSVAGKQAGLKGERSHLFFEAVRVIHGMQEETNGLYPEFAIWENVPGALSSSGGRDFAAVLESLAGGTVSLPRSGRWTNAGVAFGPRGQVAWRILDAQYWGVPQRRRRIFLVADFRGERAGEILFVEPGLSGDFEEGRKAGEEAAACAGEGVDTTILFEPRSQDGVPRIHGRGISPTLNTMQGGQRQPCIAQCLTTGTGRRYDPETETLVVHPQITGTLCASGAGMSRPAGMGSETDLVVATTYDPKDLGRRPATFKDVSPTLKARAGTGGNNVPVTQVGYAVRRLTVIECLRLMGFPDNWLDDIPGNLDTACYKAIGNSLAVPVVEWIFNRLVKVMSKELPMTCPCGTEYDPENEYCPDCGVKAE